MYPFGYRMRFVRLRAYAKIGALPISGGAGRRSSAHEAAGATQAKTACPRRVLNKKAGGFLTARPLGSVRQSVRAVFPKDRRQIYDNPAIITCRLV